MCHLDGLKAARNLLPWPSPWDRAWLSITKIIDSLHIRNHKDKSCQEKYSPATLKEELPEGNTMAAEQTFVWLSRFKKILCAMPKVHHLFYLHRLMKRRNKYTGLSFDIRARRSHCYQRPVIRRRLVKTDTILWESYLVDSLVTLGENCKQF